MTNSRKFGVALLAGIIALGSLELGESIGIPGVHGYVTQAQARVGRPLSPVSVAGVARRSVRRCAAGVTCY